MNKDDRSLLQEIASDVKKIKTEIVALRIRVAAVSATVALVTTLVTGLLFNELASKPASAGQQGIRPDYHVQGPQTPGVSDRGERQAPAEGAGR